jgi:hypothetical protein
MKEENENEDSMPNFGFDVNQFSNLAITKDKDKFIGESSEEEVKETAVAITCPYC